VLDSFVLSDKIHAMNETYTILKKKIKETLAKAEEKFDVAFPTPTVLFDLRGHTAGQAFFGKNKIRLNRYLLEKYGEDFINRTVVHELGHLIAYKLYGVNGRGHGSAWKRVMRAIGGPTTRCHSYETKAARKTNKHSCHCDRCGHSYELGAIRVNRIKKGAKYTHPACGGRVVVGKSPALQQMYK
jgi:SprT protein